MPLRLVIDAELFKLFSKEINDNLIDVSEINYFFNILQIIDGKNIIIYYNDAIIKEYADIVKNIPEEVLFQITNILSDDERSIKTESRMTFEHINNIQDTSLKKKSQYLDVATSLPNKIILSTKKEIKEIYNPNSKFLFRYNILVQDVFSFWNELAEKRIEVRIPKIITNFIRNEEKFGEGESHFSGSLFLDPAPSSQLPTYFAVSGFSADLRTEQDHIGIGAEVDAFAYLIAAKSLQPPMAIGLFGDWGSGKSFFMESLRKRIHKITADAQLSNRPQKEISIYKYIAQIEFNAWHYVEGELWASLVEHIFRNLKTKSKDNSTLLQQRQQAVIEKLEIQHRAQQEAEAREAELKRQFSQAKERVIKLEKERDDALQKLNNLKARDILKAIPLTGYEKDVQTLENLGIMRNLKNASDLMQSADELRAVLERGNALTTRLRERGWRSWIWAAALIFIILIGPIIYLALSWISELPPVTNALVSVAAFWSGLIIMLKTGTMWLSSTLKRVEDVRLKLDAKRNAEAANYVKEIAEVKRQYHEKVEEYNQAKKKEKETAREIDELEQELQRITPGRLLLDFINERVSSLDYRKHLGIPAMIRSDFEQLSQLIAVQNEKFVNEDNGMEKEEDPHMINRIVLYIDDLDRCPPDRVVQVLQAVHLLLAFPLFVVIVAVDARWLSQSLQTHYQNLLATSSLKDDQELSKGFGRQASPQDYLEKIFQVPFWVRPLSEKARISIVEGLVKESLVPSSGTSMETGNDQVKIDQSGSEDPIDASILKELETDLKISGRRCFNVDATTDLMPQGLDIEAIELQFMGELRSLLGKTPRSVKRFINIYRLIKVISLNQEAKFVEDRPDANFKLVLFLLAVLTGLPTISSDFFRQLRTERSEIEQTLTPDSQASPSERHNLGQVVEALHEVILGAPQTLPVGSVLVGQDPKVILDKAGSGPAIDRGYEEWNACHDLDRLESWLKKYDRGSWLKFDATILANWAPQVVRFSYQREDL